MSRNKHAKERSQTVLIRSDKIENVLIVPQMVFVVE
jgi:hypothetical protein